MKTRIPQLLRAATLGLTLAGSAAAPTLAFSHEASAQTPDAPVFVKGIPDEATFEGMSKVINAERFVKFLIDVQSGEIYYFNVNIYELHREFFFGSLARREMTPEDVEAFNLNYGAEKPLFILGTLTRHEKTGLYTYALWAGDQASKAQLLQTYARLHQTFFAKPVAFRPDSTAQEDLGRQIDSQGYPVVFNDQLYKTAEYQSFNNGKTVGRLKVVPVGTPYDQLIFDRYDVVVLQEAYPDISPVSGILSTHFSTPLAHVNLRARAWGVPNAGFIHAGRDYEKLDGQIVVFETRDADHTLRPASADEIKAFDARAQAARKIEVPPADLKTRSLKLLTEIRQTDARTYGAKTSNLGEIARAKLPDVHVPAGFGVPFAFYDAHLKAHKLDARIDAMLADWRWNSDPDWRRSELEALRKAIEAAPIDPKLLNDLWSKVQKDLGGAGVFVRSSTNAEDLDGFNGAGLYETVANVKDKDALSQALRHVWASVWSFRAVEERALYGIDHRGTKMGVMIQVGVNATAAGVLVTSNLLDPRDKHRWTINAKWGLGMRVVGGTRIPEQILYDTSNDGVRILSRSDDPVMLVFDDKIGGLREVNLEGSQTQPILTEPRAKALAGSVKAFLPLFKWKRPADVEWVVEGDKVWIVQARPFVE